MANVKHPSLKENKKQEGTLAGSSSNPKNKNRKGSTPEVLQKVFEAKGKVLVGGNSENLYTTLTATADNDTTKCKHREYKKFGKDRHGIQRYRCLKCMATWTDKRRDNRVDKSMWVYTQDMLLDWLDGHSYRTIARNYKLSPYYVHTLFHYLLPLFDNYMQLMGTHEDRLFIKHIGIDGGYVSSNKGKVCFLNAVDLESNTMIGFKEAIGETTEEIYKFITMLTSQYPNITTITSDLAQVYDHAIKRYNEKHNANIERVHCRVHMFMALRGKKHGLAIALQRKYRANAVMIESEKWIRQLIFNTNSQASFDFNMSKCKQAISGFSKPQYKKYLTALEYIEKNWQHILNKDILYFIKSNNKVESWWNLLKTKMKTARSLQYDTIILWFNLFALRYHFNHLNHTGTKIDTGKRFQFFKYPDFATYLSYMEKGFTAIIQQHNFKRSLILSWQNRTN